MPVELAVSTPAYLDMTFVGLEALPGPGEERFAGDLLRSPGGGAITAVAAARLGLQTALVAPLGTDLAGEIVKSAVEQDGVLVAGFRPGRTAQTVIMPVGEQRTMVTVDPGARAQGGDIAALQPAAVACNLEQLSLIPEGARRYLTCGDDDARAFSRRLPAELAGAQALFLSDDDAMVLTATDSVEQAAEHLAEYVETVGITIGARGLLAMAGRRRVDVPDFDSGPVVDPTGDRDLLCAAYAWADMRGADVEDGVAWAQLYSRLSMTVPTATAGALSEERLLEEGAERGLMRPSGVRA